MSSIAQTADVDLHGLHGRRQRQGVPDHQRPDPADGRDDHRGLQGYLEDGPDRLDPAVGVTCLFDTVHGSYLVEVRKGNGMSNSVVQPMGTVNMGDPESLRDFIMRSITNYPAERYALVLWNHGLGWLDVDIYARVRASGAGDGASGRRARALPLHAGASCGGEQTRPIAFDDSSKDFLDTKACAWRCPRRRRRPAAGWT